MSGSVRRPLWIASWATPGSGLPFWVLAMRSPITNTSCRSGVERSSSTQTRPALSSGTVLMISFVAGAAVMLMPAPSTAKAAAITT